MRLEDLSLWRSFTIETSWSPDVAAKELSRWIRKPRYFRLWDGQPTYFVGRPLDDRTFRFSTREPGSKGPAVKIDVTIEPSKSGGSLVRVHMGQASSFLVLFPFLLFMAFILSMAPRSPHSGRAPGPMGFVMLLILVPGVWALHLAEMRRAENRLLDIFAVPGSSVR